MVIDCKLYNRASNLLKIPLISDPLKKDLYIDKSESFENFLFTMPVTQRPFGLHLELQLFYTKLSKSTRRAGGSRIGAHRTLVVPRFTLRCVP